MTAHDFATALGSTESGNSALTWGDWITENGVYLPQAMGRFQCHPSAFQTWAAKFSIVAEVDETWDSVMERLVQALFAFGAMQGLQPVESAMWWHRGHECKPTDPDWDGPYAGRFEKAAGV